MGLIVTWNSGEVASWNRACEELWGVREHEVVGRNLFSLDTGMPFEALRRPLLSVLHGDEPAHAIELDAVNRRGKAIRCRVRMLPLRGDTTEVVGALLLIESPPAAG